MNNMRDFYQVSLKILLKNERGEFLLMKARMQDTYGGYYDLPGGRIDVSEFTKPLPSIIARELREEVGDIVYTLNERPVAVGRHNIDIQHNRSGKDIHVFYLFFEAQYTSGEIIVSTEHEGYTWVDLTKEDPAKYLKSGNLEGVQMYLSGL